MKATTHELSFNGELLQRGFWLYIWEITRPDGLRLYYVGRTGDSSSSNAQSPFNRMGHHLSSNDKSNVLRRHLENRGVAPERCNFRLVAYGPIIKEAAMEAGHRKSRDKTAAMEKALADALAKVGYTVMNSVKCRMALDETQFTDVRAAFAAQFPELASCVRSGGNA